MNFSVFIHRHQQITLLALILLSPIGHAASALTHAGQTLMYSTGVDLNSAGVDNHYRLSAIGGNALSPSLDMGVVSAGFLSANDADSQWISHTTANIANTTYIASTTLDLTGIDLSSNTFSLSGYWLSDNKGLDIIVNGVSTGQTNTGSHATTPQSDEENLFTISSDVSTLVSGINTVDFLWENGTPTFPNISPVSLRVRLENYSITAQPIPLPATVWMFIPALLGIVRFKSR